MVIYWNSLEKRSLAVASKMEEVCQRKQVVCNNGKPNGPIKD